MSTEDLNSLHGIDRRRAYQRLYYRKKVLKNGGNKRPSAILRLQEEIEELRGKRAEEKVRELLENDGKNYKDIMREYLLKLEPNLDTLLASMNESSAEFFVDKLKDDVHQKILGEYIHGAK